MFGEIHFLMESYKCMHKNQILEISRAPSKWNQWVSEYAFNRCLIILVLAVFYGGEYVKFV